MKKNIVLLHGWGASADKLGPLDVELKKKGWNTLSAKLPGFDLKPPKKPWDLYDYSKFVEKKATKQFKNDEFIVFGHSFGGRIAIKLAITPELKKNMVGVVLCSAGGISRGNPAKRTVFYFIAKIGKVLLLIPLLAKVFRKLMYRVAGEHDYEKTDGVMKETFLNIIGEVLKAEVGKINDPTLILWGKKDRVTPVKDAHYLNKNINNSDLIVYEEKTHNVPYIEAKKVATDIDSWHGKHM